MHLAQRFEGMMADAIIQGTLRSIDAMILSHFLMVSTNAAYDLQFWPPRRTEKETALRIYARRLIFGLFNSPVIGPSEV